VTQFGYINPNIIVIYGLDVESNRCSFVVHMSRVELEVRIRAIDQPVKRNTIGFIHPTAKAATPAVAAPAAAGSTSSAPAGRATDASAPPTPAPPGAPPNSAPPTP
ncbi:MAG TPA: hypothetical protein VFD32_03175, partial [Dehalococcoidia bacterium]|nr:hypothetical protein [Dehalococcoidia bacterium]